MLNGLFNDTTHNSTLYDEYIDWRKLTEHKKHLSIEFLPPTKVGSEQLGCIVPIIQQKCYAILTIRNV